jgi:type I restriction enzyme M protein
MSAADLPQPDRRVTDRLLLTGDGRIIDFFDRSSSRANTPEERVRQNYARTLHYQFGYPVSVMALEAPINIGSDRKFADIVIYEDETAARSRDQGRIKLVIETKAPDEKTGYGQLVSYISASSAEGGVWINDKDPPKYYRRIDGKLEEWPGIPREDEAWESIGKQTKAALRVPHNLVETFKRCHNALYKVGIDSEDIAMDMVRIILAKYRDESSEGDVPEFRVTPLELQSAAGRRRVAERVRRLFVQVRDDYLDVFDKHETITAGDREIATVVSELQDFRFVTPADSDEVYDVVGAAYEVYIGSHLKGDRGQYFTHRLIVGLLVRIVNPSVDDKVFDPAMGSGGFLIRAMRHVTGQIMASKRSQAAKSNATRGIRQRLYGIDKSAKLVKVARTNMILASDGHSGLIRGDSLEPPDKLPEDFLRVVGPGIPTVILTNPPFGATAEHKITPERDPELISQFEVAHVWRRKGSQLRPTSVPISEGVPPEYLFVERCIKWVSPGGKIGIVVPRGLLDNDRALALRTLILQETQILAVINCHDDTFKPYTDAKAALLVLERNTPQGSLEIDHSIFMAISQGIGHNGVGAPVYKTDATGDVIIRDGEPVLDEDTDDIYRAWELIGRGEPSPSEYCFTIARSQITANPNLNLNPVRYLPRYAESRRRVLEMGERPGWSVENLGQIASVFGGSRLKRPYADKGVTSGTTIRRFFTGNAVTQTRGENVKYLDLAKAKPGQLRMIDKMYLRRGMILITRSGTVGRVVYATQYHEGAVGTEDVIRVVIADDALRGYVYQFLLSQLGQDQLRANVYGAIVDHIEPDHVKGVQVPIPTGRHLLDQIGLPVIHGIELQEQAQREMNDSMAALAESMNDPADEPGESDAV